MERRILFSDNGTLSDFSTSLNNYNAGSSTFSLVAAEDAFYIGTSLPFNHIYIKMGATLNEEASVIKVEHYDGSAWKEMVEVRDETVGLTKSGYISWVPNRNNSWQYKNTDEIAVLNSVVIYDLYWTRLTFSADLTASTIISWMGQLFSDDDDLGSEYPDLVKTNFLSAIESGKTTYQEQAQRAADVIVRDLRARNMVSDKNQILDKEDLRLASVSKVADIVYGMLGDDYIDNKKGAKAEYSDRIQKSFLKIDTNADGGLSKQEGKIHIRRLFR